MTYECKKDRSINQEVIDDYVNNMKLPHDLRKDVDLSIENHINSCRICSSQYKKQLNEIKNSYNGGLSSEIIGLVVDRL